MIPPASTVGHRAELWDVENPLQEVTSSVVTCGDDCWVRLHDVVSGDLFAECPIMKGKPLTSSVEPVVDSSRYFVLRVVDRDSGRHAFIGFGFRQRAHATDFTAALSDYQQYLRRSEEAIAMQQAFAAAESGEQGPNLPVLDFSLKPGETVSLKLSAKVPSTRGSFLTERMAAMPTTEAHPSEDGAGALLPPPPALLTAQEATSRAVSGPLLPYPLNNADQAQQVASIGGTAGAGDSRKVDGNEAGSSAIDDCSETKLVEESSVDEEFGSFVG
ncbi:Adaptin ear-binding coat-associated protein 2 [Coccomyxa sp. Obi]|nr:Adaptin ear-binding coat-associated protein 2 [Coccomyxa sp. Obi]